MTKYTYYKGTENSREVVEFETTAEPLYRATICVVDIDLLLCGVASFPCGSGDDVKLTLEQQRDILLLVQEERGKLTRKTGPKSLTDWYNSGLRTFEEYFAPGDTVTEDLVDYFINIMPPQTMWSNLVQAGEPFSHENDSKGNYRATFITFAKKDGEWQFAGYCFSKETQNRITRKGKLADRIFDVQYLIEAEKHRQAARRSMTST